MSDLNCSDGKYKMTDPQTKLITSVPPVIDITGTVGAPMYEYVRNAIMYLHTEGNPPINVVISTGGGDVQAGLSIYDLLRLYEGETTALVQDKAVSMGAIILQACDIRNCSKHGRVLIHHLKRNNLSLDILRSERKLKKLIDELEVQQKRMDDVLYSRTGRTRSQIRKQCLKDEMLKAPKALEFGRIDSIV